MALLGRPERLAQRVRKALLALRVLQVPQERPVRWVLPASLVHRERPGFPVLRVRPVRPEQRVLPDRKDRRELLAHKALPA